VPLWGSERVGGSGERARGRFCFPEKEGWRLEKTILTGGPRQSEREGQRRVGLGWFVSFV
jgi:hypothetical protein